MLGRSVSKSYRRLQLHGRVKTSFGHIGLVLVQKRPAKRSSRGLQLFGRITYFLFRANYTFFSVGSGQSSVQPAVSTTCGRQYLLWP